MPGMVIYILIMFGRLDYIVRPCLQEIKKKKKKMWCFGKYLFLSSSLHNWMMNMFDWKFARKFSLQMKLLMKIIVLMSLLRLVVFSFILMDDFHLPNHSKKSKCKKCNVFFFLDGNSFFKYYKSVHCLSRAITTHLQRFLANDLGTRLLHGCNVDHTSWTWQSKL